MRNFISNINILGNGNKSNKLIYLLMGFFGFVLFFLFLLVYKPIDRYRKGRTLQALDPDKLSDDERWDKERTIQEYENERTRRKMMRQDIYA